MELRVMDELLKSRGIYMEITDRKYQRGYKARRHYNMAKEEVLFVPQTSKRRRGQAYILEPRYDTTKYCTRIYFNVNYDMLKELGIL